MERKEEVNRAFQILWNFFDDDDDDDDEDDIVYENDDTDDLAMFFVLGKKIINPIPRLQNYVEEIVPTYSDYQFKSHFRYTLTS